MPTSLVKHREKLVERGFDTVRSITLLNDNDFGKFEIPVGHARVLMLHANEVSSKKQLNCETFFAVKFVQRSDGATLHRVAGFSLSAFLIKFSYLNGLFEWVWANGAGISSFDCSISLPFSSNSRLFVSYTHAVNFHPSGFTLDVHWTHPALVKALPEKHKGNTNVAYIAREAEKDP